MKDHAMRIIVIEPLEIVRAGLRALFDSPEHRPHELTIAAEDVTPGEMLPLYAELLPDVVLTEVQFPGATAFVEIDSLKSAFPAAKVLVYTASDNPAFLARASVGGVDEYLEMTGPTAELVAALIRLHEGKDRPIGHKLDRMALRMKSKRRSTDAEIPLTGRELQVLRHVAFGMSNKEIARSLEISVDTVKEHVQNILRKMGFRDRTHAAVWAVRKKII